MRAVVWGLGLAFLLPLAGHAQPRPDISRLESAQGPARPADPPSQPAARPTEREAAPRPGEREAVVINELGLTIRELYLAPTTQTDPGPDRLGADTLTPGGTFRVRLGRNQPCAWNLRAVLADDSVQERRNVDLCRTTRVTFGDPSLPLREATILNDTDMTVRELYVTGPASPARGPDRLGAEVIPPGRTFRLRLGRTRDCAHDVIAVLEDGSEISRQNLDLCRIPRLTLADPAVPWREAAVLNRAGRPIVALNAVPAGRAPTGTANPEAWGPDRLPESLSTAGLADGARFRLRLRLPTCAADLRATYADGRAEEKRAADLCRETTVTFDGSGIPRPVERPITLVNRHGATLEEIYVSSSTDGDWGPERLPGGIPRGGRETLRLPVECTVDLRVVFPNGAAEERREVDICRTPSVVVRAGWTLAARLDEGDGETRPDGPTPGAVRLRNTARVPMVELYLDAPNAPPGAPRGTDRLGATVLGVNETLDLAPPEPGACAVRLTAVFRDGREVVRDFFDLCAGTEVALP